MFQKNRRDEGKNTNIFYHNVAIGKINFGQFCHDVTIGKINFGHFTETSRLVK